MARTTMTTSDSLRKVVWEEQLFRDTVLNSYFMGRFAGQAPVNLNQGAVNESTPNDVIHIKENLAAKGRTGTRPGDKMYFGLIPRISPSTYRGVTSGQKLKGKEVALSWYNFSIELERYRQAVSGGSPMDWQRASFDMPTESRNALLNWGVEMCDLLCVEALDASPTSTFYTASGTLTRTATYATAKGAITSTDKLTPELVSFVKTWAKTGGGRSTAGQYPIRPIMVEGKPYYVLVVYPDCLYDWANDPTVAQAHREALERGKDNPIFKGASYIWDGVVIHEYEGITIGADAGSGSNVPYAHAHLLGAQSLVWAWGERPSIVEDTEDYEEDLFYAWRMTAKAAKPTFNSIDYGSVSVCVARTNVSGA